MGAAAVSDGAVRHCAGPNADQARPVTSLDVAEGDAELAARAAAGDAAAFGVLYDRYVGRLYRYTYLRVKDRMEAEDVTSETFIRALQAIDRYEPRRPFSAWLFRIARNAAIDRGRQRRSEETAMIRAADPAGASVDPEDIGIAHLTSIELRRALDHLTPIQREVVLLRFFGDLSTEEICAALGKGASTIRGIQHRALLALRSRVQPGLL